MNPETSINSETSIRVALDELGEALENAIESEQSDSTVAAEESALSEVSYPSAGNLSTGDLNPPIPENSESLNIKEKTSRFSGAVWFDKVKEKKVILAGLGGIGSWTSVLLSRLDLQMLALYDDDTVDLANLSGQLFTKQQIGISKVTALASSINNFSDYHRILGHTEKFTSLCSPADIMICGFDNMEARKEFFYTWNTHLMEMPPEDRKHCLFIDGRLNAETLQVLCIRGDDGYNLRRYSQEWLFSDDEAEAAQCSYKQTSFMANMIASIIVNLFVNFCANDLEGENAPAIERDLPFLTTYEASMMLFNTEA